MSEFSYVPIIVRGSNCSNFTELSLFSRMSLNDREKEGSNGRREGFSIISDSYGKKRKMSMGWMNASSVGNNNYLLRSIAKGSQHGYEHNESEEFAERPRRQPSEISCPVLVAGQNRCIQDFSSKEHISPPDDFSAENIRLNFPDLQEQKPRFTKTKNLLRTFSNYFHKYLKYNKRAKRFFIAFFFSKQNNKQSLEDKFNDFLLWVGELSLVNFCDYEKVWTQPHQYRTIYRIMCFKYYRDEAYCDIQKSRLTTKKIANALLFQFIQGLSCPKAFNRFK